MPAFNGLTVTPSKITNYGFGCSLWYILILGFEKIFKILQGFKWRYR